MIRNTAATGCCIILAAAVCPAAENWFATAGLSAAIEDNVYRTSRGEPANAARVVAGAGRRFSPREGWKGTLDYNGSFFYFPSLSDLNLAFHDFGARLELPVSGSVRVHGGLRAGLRRGSAVYRELDYTQVEVIGGVVYARASGLELGIDYTLRSRDYSRTGPGYTAHEPAFYAAGAAGRLRWRIEAEAGFKNLEPVVVQSPSTGTTGHHHGGGFGMNPRVQTVPQPSVQRAAVSFTGSVPLGGSTGLRLGASLSRVLKGVSPYFPGLDLLQNGYSLERFDDFYSFEGWTLTGRLTRLLPLDSNVRLQADYRRLDYPGRPTLGAGGEPIEPFTQRSDKVTVVGLRFAKEFPGLARVERLALTAGFTYYRNASNDAYFNSSDRLWTAGFEVGL